MARLFDDSSSERLGLGNALFTTEPVTVSAWCFPDDATPPDEFCIFNVTNSTGGGTKFWTLRLDDSSGNILRPQWNVKREGTLSITNATALATVNAWNHVAAVERSSTDRSVWLNGGNRGNDTTDVGTSTTFDLTNIGATELSENLSDFFSGSIAEVAVWDIDLDEAEIFVLAAGFSPLFVRPGNLILYMPLVRAIDDYVGNNVFTATGTTVSAHPPMIYPSTPYIITTPAEAAAFTGELNNPIFRLKARGYGYLRETS